MHKNFAQNNVNGFKIIPWLVAVSAFVVLFLAFFLMNVSYNNKYTALVVSARARQDVSKVTFDNTWKVIAGQAKVAEKERETFRATFVEIMNSRVQNDKNLVFKWGQEAQVPISPDLFLKIQQTIESQRNVFTQAQKELIDIKREADTMRSIFPGSLFLSGREEIKVQIVTSSRTESAFESGEDNTADPFSE